MATRIARLACAPITLSAQASAAGWAQITDQDGAPLGNSTTAPPGRYLALGQTTTGNTLLNIRPGQRGGYGDEYKLPAQWWVVGVVTITPADRIIINALGGEAGATVVLIPL